MKDLSARLLLHKDRELGSIRTHSEVSDES
jgi:hypothetical protein